MMVLELANIILIKFIRLCIQKIMLLSMSIKMIDFMSEIIDVVELFCRMNWCVNHIIIQFLIYNNIVKKLYLFKVNLFLHNAEMNI